MSTFLNAELSSAQILRPRAVSAVVGELPLAWGGKQLTPWEVPTAVILLYVQYIHFSYLLFSSHLKLPLVFVVCGKLGRDQCPCLGVWSVGEQGPLPETGVGVEAAPSPLARAWSQQSHGKPVRVVRWHDQGVQIKNLSVHILSNERPGQTLWYRWGPLRGLTSSATSSGSVPPSFVANIDLTLNNNGSNLKEDRGWKAE